MMLVLNIEFVKYVHVGFVRTKNRSNGVSSTVQINPTKYLVQPTLFRHAQSYVPTNPKGGACSNSEKTNFNMLF